MTFKLKRIAPLQAGKMLAAFYGLFSLLFIPIFVGLMGFSAMLGKTAAANAPSLAMTFGMGIGMIVIVPIFYAVIGFVGGVVGAFIYNLLAGWMGGFELEFTPVPAEGTP